MQKADVTKMGEACLFEEASELPRQYPNQTNDPCGPAAWYALKVRTGSEVNVAAKLLDRGVIPYCPIRKERRRYSDRMKVVSKAAFPGYLFCRFNINRKTSVISSPGVEYVLGVDGKATPVPDEELHHLARTISAGASPVFSMTPGQRVRVTHGPLRGVEGTLVRDDSGAKLVVSINLLSQGAALHLPEDQICPIEAGN